MSTTQTTQTTESNQPTIILNADDVQRTLKRLTHEMLEANHGCENLVIMGIKTRGVPLAARVAKLVESIEGASVPVGTLDITLYRDDADQTFKPTGESLVPVDLTGQHVVLIDDVLYKGRTVRAALDALNAYGRPASVQLLVLVDRGHRELPISPNYVGKNLPSAKTDHVSVRLQEIDGDDCVSIHHT